MDHPPLTLSGRLTSRDQCDERLPFLDDIGCELCRVALAYVLRRVGRPGGNHQDLSGLVGRRALAFHLIFDGALEHIDDLFTGVRVPWQTYPGSKSTRTWTTSRPRTLRSCSCSVVRLDPGCFVCA